MSEHENPQNEEAAPTTRAKDLTMERYGAFLKDTDLKREVEVVIEDRSTGPNMGHGAFINEGRFGEQLTIAFSVSGIPKRVSMPTKGNDAKMLIAIFGAPGKDGAWVGRRIKVRADENLSFVRVNPA